MVLFNELVLDTVIRGTPEVVSASQRNVVLGKADNVIYEVEVLEATGTAPTLTLRHLHSNGGNGFIGMTALLAAVDISAPPYRNVKGQAGPLGGLGQVGITLGGTNPVARVRVWAVGRSA